MLQSKSWSPPALTKHDLIRQLGDLLKRLIACDAIKPSDLMTFHQLTRDIEAVEATYADYVDNLMADRYHASSMRRDTIRAEAKEWMPEAHAKPWPDHRK